MPAHMQRSDMVSYLKTGAFNRIANQIKIGAGPTGDKEYEKALAQIGYNQLQASVSELMPYLQGFQLLDKSDDAQFAAGSFVFDANGMICDIPVFMIKGKIKGYQLLFLRDRQMFIPAREGLIRHLLSGKNQLLGQVGPRNGEMRPQRVTPNVDVFGPNNRYLQKVSSFFPAWTSEWGRQSGAWQSMVSFLGDPRTLEVRKQAFAGRLESLQLRELLQDGNVQRKLAQWCAMSPKLARRVPKLLGDIEITPARKVARVDPNRVITLGRQPVVSIEPTHCTIYTGIPTAEMQRQYPDVVQEKVAFGHFVIDHRPASRVKIAMRIQEDLNWSRPNISGKASIASSDGELQDYMVVLPADRLPGSSSSSLAVVLKPDGAAVSLVAPGEIASAEPDSESMVMPSGGGYSDSYRSWISGLSEIGDLRIPEDTSFILVDSTGIVAGPFTSRGSNIPGQLDVGSASVKTVEGPEREMNVCCSSDAYDPIRSIRVSDTAARMQSLNNRHEGSYGSLLIVPPDTKMLKLQREPESSYRVQSAPIIPMSDLTIEELSSRSSFAVRKSAIAPGYVELDGKVVSGLVARQRLLEKGLSKEASADVLANATSQKQHFVILPQHADIKSWQLATTVYDKLAAGVYMPPQNVGMFTGDLPMQQTGQSAGVIPITEQYPAELEERYMMERADPMDPNWASSIAPYASAQQSQMPGSPQDSAAVDQLNNSSDGLFENTLFQSLIRHGRPDTAISQLISSLYETCDKIGRFLMLVYAQQDELIDRYGRNDLELMEEQALGMNASAGDFLVDLLDRSVDPSNDIALANVGQT